MTLLARRCMLGALAGLGVTQATRVAAGERSLRVIVPQAPGGAADNLVRLIGEGLSPLLRRRVLVDHRPGGGTVLGTLGLAQAAPDGDTIGLVLSTVAINQAMRQHMPYDVLTDLQPVCLGGHSLVALVARADLSADSMAEFLALAARSQHPLQYASLGVGSSTHLCGELLQLRTGIELQHVPYNGSPPVYQALLGGQLPAAFVTMDSALPYIAAGRLKALGVTSPRRSREFPQVPAIAETVAGFQVVGFFGFMAPAQTPVAVVKTLYSALAETLNSAALRRQLAAQAVVVGVQGPAEFAAFLRDQIAQYAALAKRTGIRIE